MKNPFKLENTFELDDLNSLAANNLQPLVKRIYEKCVIKLQGGLVTLYSLDIDNNEVLFVIDTGDNKPSVYLMKVDQNVPPASVKVWKEERPFVFDNHATATDLNQLFSVKEITNPDGVKFIRTLPAIINNEKCGDAHLNVGTGPALMSDPNAAKFGKLVGNVTLYEAEDKTKPDSFILLVQLMNEANKETGGLLSFYTGYQVQPSEIK